MWFLQCSGFQATPPGVEKSPDHWTEVLGVSVFHWLVTTQGQPGGLLSALACSLPAAAQEVSSRDTDAEIAAGLSPTDLLVIQVLVVVCDCCVRELATTATASTLSTAQDSITEQRLVEIAQVALCVCSNGGLGTAVLAPCSPAWPSTLLQYRPCSPAWPSTLLQYRNSTVKVSLSNFSTPSHLILALDFSPEIFKILRTAR